MMRRDATLANVLDKLAEHVQEYKAVESYGFRTYVNSSRSQSVLGSRSTPSIVRLFTTDFKEFLSYETMAGASVFDMNMEVKNLPTTDLEVVKSTAGTRKYTLERYMKSFAVPNASILEENSRAEEIKAQSIEEKVYEVIHLIKYRNF
jgi:hypothetical protein